MFNRRSIRAMTPFVHYVVCPKCNQTLRVEAKHGATTECHGLCFINKGSTVGRRYYMDVGSGVRGWSDTPIS